jgi:hypothetical protein
MIQSNNEKLERNKKKIKHNIVLLYIFSLFFFISRLSD